MTAIDIRIQAAHEAPPFPDLIEAQVVLVDVTRAVVLESATARGDVGLILLGKQEGGKWVQVGMTGGMCEMVLSAVKGARQRFTDALAVAHDGK